MPNIPQSTEKIIQEFIDRVNKLLGKRVKEDYTIWLLC